MPGNELAGQEIAVLGAGTMGRGIAQLALQAGAKVTIIDPVEKTHAEALRALADTFDMLASKERLIEPPQALLARLSFSTDLTAAAAAAWVFEAAPERLELKRELFAELERAAPKARLATNTSTLPVTAIASACEQPERVVGVHFFNPAPLMRLVEVIPGVQTSPAVVEEALAVARALGREPVLAQDRPGFIVNRVARPYYGEALRLLGEGADHTAIDTSLRAAGFRMGPFELLDLIGLDVNLAATLSVYEAFYQLPRYRPHPLQQALVSAGRLGRKSGHGFYRYPRAPQSAEATAREGTNGASAVNEALPRVHVLGSGAAADHLRRSLPADALSEGPAEAELILDARPALEEKLAQPEGSSALRLVLCWMHSVSAFVGVSRAIGSGGPSATVGFSLLPPPARLAASSGPTSRPAANGSAAIRPLTLELMEPVTGASNELNRARELLERLGVVALELPDQPGGAAFRIFALLLNEAVSAVAEQLASPTDIDLAMRLGVNYPEGPLTWAAELGLSEVCAALASLHEETGAARFAPHALLRRLVAAGGVDFSALRQGG